MSPSKMIAGARPQAPMQRAELTLTLPEDNTGNDGVPSSFLIPMTAVGGGGFDPPGLLDLFEVGPHAMAPRSPPPAVSSGVQRLV